MRSIHRSVRFVPFVALAFAAAAFWAVEAAPAAAGTPSVTIIDNDGTLGQAGFDPVTGWWGFGPVHLEVPKGTMVAFNNPATNKRPHTVTDVKRPGGPYESSLNVGTVFDSSPTQEALITVGNSWTLDTSNLDPGHYGYYCRLHPWMVGSITVMGQ